MAIENLTTAATDGERVNRLFEAMAILDGLQAYAEREDDGQGPCTTVVQLSRTARAILEDVTASLNP
jgi:hypothetical protein